MFWNKKKSETIQPVAEETSRITVIPTDFYGGNDPIIHYKQASKQKVGKIPGTALGINKKMLLGLGMLVIIFTVGVSWYYLSQTNKKIPAQPVVTNNLENNQVAENIGMEISEVVTSTVVSSSTMLTPTTTEAQSLEEIPLLFPNTAIPNSTDMDSDGLTDVEEALFGTDPGVMDGDNDGYYDGQELINLYNPKGTAPVKLIDSGLVGDYVNPGLQYRVYYPVSWEVAAVDPKGKQVLFSSILGDFISVEAYQKNGNETFADWFGAKAVGQQYSDLIPFKNRFEENGFKRRDGLVAYFISGNNIYVFIYHPGDKQVIAFPQVLEMMIASFRPSKTLVEIPEQQSLPVIPDYAVLTSTPSEVSTLFNTTSNVGNTSSNQNLF